MEIYPSIAKIFFFFILQKYVQFFSSSFVWFCIYELFVHIFFFFFLFFLFLVFHRLYLFINYQNLYFLLQQGFHLFNFQVAFELCLYVHYQIKLIFLNSKIFMLLFLIFIFVVSNIICVPYKNVTIRQLISQKRIIFFFFLANEIPLVKFPQVFNY